MKTITKNSTLPEVAVLQHLLSAHGFRVPFSGVFDNSTDAVVRQFQQANSLKADGVVGPITWAELKRLDHLILIDNGHGKETPGKRSPKWADGSQLFEWKYTREIAQRVESELRKHKVHVVNIVTEETDIPLSERCRRANNIAGQMGTVNCFLVSIHCNAFDGRARGWEVHTYLGTSKSDEYAAVFWQTANRIVKGRTIMRGETGVDGPDRDSNLQILRETICPAILTENLFMDNETDCRFLLSPEGETAIVDVHVQAILKILGK